MGYLTRQLVAGAVDFNARDGETLRYGHKQPRRVSRHRAGIAGLTGARRHRVLVVEDSALLGMLLGDLLGVMGFEVCAITATQSDAVVAARRHQPGLMIVDINLGQGNGVLAVEEILCSGFIPHLFMSGNLRWFSALPAGTVTLLKPFFEAELADAIGRVFAAGVPAARGGGTVAARDISTRVGI